MQVYLIIGEHGVCSDWHTWIAAGMLSQEASETRKSELVDLISLLAHCEPYPYDEAEQEALDGVVKQIAKLDKSERWQEALKQGDLCVSGGSYAQETTYIVKPLTIEE